MSCFIKSPYVKLPDQRDVCGASSSSVCQYAKKRVLLAWQKRLIVLTSRGQLLVYKEPLVGKIYDLNNVSYIELKTAQNGMIVSLKSDKKKLTLLLEGADANAWASRLLDYRRTSLSHATHNEKFSFEMRHKEEKPDQQQNGVSSKSQQKKSCESVTTCSVPNAL
ncbi:hypothetical protein WR25_14481 [Diploscapter pachys]|uniref:PH-15 domain-containing protein n=1 Tax=Diploscapter pachys TaxID=2018661 RepID=A0A2A2LCJ6_9BILA|nr:hypothetical protein WR25_14481 [Diploscapter pachys]